MSAPELSNTPEQPDPTLIRNQPSLTTSSGLIWLVVGGLFAAISIVVLAFLVDLQPVGLALGGIVATVALYLSMILVRLFVARPQLRLGLLATAMLLMAAISLVCTLVISIDTWNL
jgi:hypothetical protein